MILTIEVFKSGASVKGGYSYKQLTLLGVGCPLEKGWQYGIIGRDFPDETINQFIALKDGHLQKRQELLQKLKELKEQQPSLF